MPIIVGIQLQDPVADKLFVSMAVQDITIQIDGVTTRSQQSTRLIQRPSGLCRNMAHPQRQPGAHGSQK